MVLRSRGRDIRPQETGPRVNHDIRVPEVRVIDEEGEQMGILSIDDAVQAAEDRDLDLVEVAPNSAPPVCKIMDYGRYKYTQQRKGKEAKKRQKIVELKEVKMRIKIGGHDYEFKKNHAQRFLLDGNKAKVTIMFRGREVTHPDLGRKLLERVSNDLMEISTIEQPPILEGRNMTMILVPNRAAAKAARESSAAKGKSDTKPPLEGADEAPTASLADGLKEAAQSSDEAAQGSDEAQSGDEAKSAGDTPEPAEEPTSGEETDDAQA
jgi:translation initiation factor IF-3